MLLGIYIVLKPYYLLPSGLPQIADILLLFILAILPLLPRVQHDSSTRRLVGCMMFFCVYAAVVNVAWSIALTDQSVAIYATYYVFDVGLLIVCLRLGALYPIPTLRAVAYAIGTSAIIQAATAVLASHAAQLRQTASFNNPNQLGYWSILSLCLFLAIAGRLKLKWHFQAIVTVCLFYLVALSLSKAAILSAALMFMLHFLKSPKLAAIAILSALAGYLVLENTTIAEHVTARLENIGQQKDDSLYSRGYLRIIEYPQYTLLGAGEGAHYRFDNVAYSAEQFEIHSTFATILFSYGMVGMTAFFLAIWQLYRISAITYLIYLAPPFLYGLTHQGLRFSFLWLLIAVLAVLGQTKIQRPIPLRPQLRR
jgi:hypothetical protein